MTGTFQIVTQTPVTSAPAVTVTSPSAGQSFVYGTTMNIQWTPASAGVAVIQLVSTSGGESPVIYSMIVNSDPVDYSGSFTYPISGIPTGTYYLRLMNPENDSVASPNPPGTVIGQSGAFTIVAPTAITSAPVISVVSSPTAGQSFPTVAP